MSGSISNLPGHVSFTGPRNTIAKDGSDEDQGPGTTGGKPAHIPTQDEIAVKAALSFHHLMKMVKDQGFDYSHPVDEYAPQGGNGLVAQSVTVQADYDMPERITNVFAVIPIGTTFAQLQLGQRTIVIYSGAALAAYQTFQLSQTGIILNSDDPRILTVTGSTGTPYLGLTGFALTRGQFS